jgi:hypothetical protein
MSCEKPLLEKSPFTDKSAMEFYRYADQYVTNASTAKTEEERTHAINGAYNMMNAAIKSQQAVLIEKQNTDLINNLIAFSKNFRNT